MMNRMWLGVLAVLALVGCGGGGGSGNRALTEVDWVDGNAPPVSIDPGYSDCVQYGGSIPAGAEIVFDVFGYGDDMVASVVPANAACDGTIGAGRRSSTNWNGTISGDTGPLAAGTYDLAVSCYNTIYPCQLVVDRFGYLY